MICGGGGARCEVAAKFLEDLRRTSAWLRLAPRPGGGSRCLDLLEARLGVRSTRVSAEPCDFPHPASVPGLLRNMRDATQPDRIPPNPAARWALPRGALPRPQIPSATGARPLL